MNLLIQGASWHVPDFFIVGAAKAGTTSLYYYLQQHNEIFLPRVKEPHYFSHVGARKPSDTRTIGQDFSTYVTDLPSYLALFADAGPHQRVGEASTTYLYRYRHTVESMRALYGDLLSSVKIIAVLRNPIERAWSSYTHLKRHGIETEDFERAIAPSLVRQRLEAGWSHIVDYVGLGMYTEQVRYYRERFKHVHVLILNDLEAKPTPAMIAVLEFLGVQSNVELRTDRKFNTSGVPKNAFAALAASAIYRPFKMKAILKRVLPKRLRYHIAAAGSSVLFRPEPVPPKYQELLYRIYENDIVDLGKMLHRDLSNWAGRT